MSNKVIIPPNTTWYELGILLGETLLKPEYVAGKTLKKIILRKEIPMAKKTVAKAKKAKSKKLAK